MLVLLIISCNESSQLQIDVESPNFESIIHEKLQDSNSSTVTTSLLKKKWEKRIFAEHGIDVKLAKFVVKESVEGTLFLKAISENNKIEIGAVMVRANDNIGYMLGIKTCTCTGCSDGCELRIVGTKCSCSTCWPSGGNCTKTETIVIED